MLRSDVAQILSQLGLGQLARSDPPSCGDHPNQNGQSDPDFDFSHPDDLRRPRWGGNIENADPD
jgi:hypothetical protein